RIDHLDDFIKQFCLILMLDANNPDIAPAPALAFYYISFFHSKTRVNDIIDLRRYTLKQISYFTSLDFNDPFAFRVKNLFQVLFNDSCYITHKFPPLIPMSISMNYNR